MPSIALKADRTKLQNIFNQFKSPQTVFSRIKCLLTRQFANSYESIYNEHKYKAMAISALSRGKIEVAALTLNGDYNKIPSMAAPNQARIEITNGCNLNCRMCSTKSSTRPLGFMEKALFENAIHQLKQIGLKAAQLHTVGEPMIYSDLNELLRIANENEFSVGFRSNGTITKQINQVYGKYGHEMNVARFSLDGATKETYEKIRRGGKFDDVINSLNAIKKLNSEEGYEIVIKNKSVLSIDNIYEIKDYFQAYSEWIDPWNHRFKLVNNMGLDKAFFNTKQNIFQHLFKCAVPCYSVFRCASIQYNGDVSLCMCRDYNGDFIVGNIHDRSLSEIYQGDLAEKMRNSHRTGRGLHPICVNCLEGFDFIGELYNAYIHYLNIHDSELDSRSFGGKLLEYLLALNKGMKALSLTDIKRVTVQYFNI